VWHYSRSLEGLLVNNNVRSLYIENDVNRNSEREEDTTKCGGDCEDDQQLVRQEETTGMS